MPPSSTDDPRGLGLLYREQHRWLQRWIMARVGGAACAPDLVQDVFLRLLAKPDPLQVEAPRGLLATVARSVLANHFRRQKLERAYLQALAALPEAVVPDLETQAILLETLHALDALLDGLERPVRQAFLWSQVEGLGHAEIGERLGISIATVKRYLIKAGARCIALNDPQLWGNA